MKYLISILLISLYSIGLSAQKKVDNVNVTESKAVLLGKTKPLSQLIAIKETDQINLYYGAGDCTVAVATASLSDCIDYLMSCPQADNGQ